MPEEAAARLLPGPDALALDVIPEIAQEITLAKLEYPAVHCNGRRLPHSIC
jgi:hypothetical protein